MIKYLKVNNFKGLSELEIDNFSKINLFGGKNNAGKTTLLEAIFLFFDRLNPNMLINQYARRGMNELLLKPETLFQPIFTNYNFEEEITISLKQGNFLQENLIIKYIEDISNQKTFVPVGKNAAVNEDQVFNSSVLELTYQGDKNKNKQISKFSIEPNGISLNIENAKNVGKNVRFLSTKNSMGLNENSILYGEIDMNGESDKLLEYLKEIEPRLLSLTSITLSNNSSNLYGDIGIGKKMPLSYMGDGIGRFLTILLSIMSNRNGIVLIDEIENGIHYSVLPTLWSVISKVSNEYNCQIFASTHSYECLAAATIGIEQSLENNFRYFRVERSLENKQIVKNFDFSTLKVSIEKGWEIR